MPVHDWSRVSAGTFHDFHCAWIVELRNVLNGGLLPPAYDAMAEQVAGDVGPDVLTLESTATAPDAEADLRSGGATTVAEVAPAVSFMAATEMDFYRLKRRTLVIRHGSDDRIVALVEIVSAGNKSSRHALQAFLDKAVSAPEQGCHLLIIDLHLPGPYDPQGIHGALWAELEDEAYRAPPEKPLTLAAYSGGLVKRAYVEPIAVGSPLPDMPLFLDPEFYINVPLEQTYAAAYRGVPQRWRRVIEGDDGA